MRQNLLAISILSGFTFLVACGGGGAASGEDPKSPSAKASIELTPMDELKAIPVDLNAEAAALTKPVDDIQAAIDEIGALPKKHGLAAAEIMGMAKGTFESGKVELKRNADVGTEAKADVEASLKKLAGAVTALKQTPDRVAALTTKIAAATAKVPVLASKVTATATAASANPFGSADAKAKGTADLANVKQVQADAMKSINEVQAKIAGVPAIATKALAKASASFTSS
ncbi:hypothetical protein BH11MYX4_BH11MYX4_13690 [soil metagenome]